MHICMIYICLSHVCGCPETIREVRSMQPKVQVVVNFQMWVLGTKLRASAGAASTLKSLSQSLQPPTFLQMAIEVTQKIDKSSHYSLERLSKMDFQKGCLGAGETVCSPRGPRLNSFQHPHGAHNHLKL